jgi:Family of unknown function (DUF5681)
VSSENTDYDVGYKRPPIPTRFKKGQSGNPRGRPKKVAGELDLGTLLQAIDNEEILVFVDGKRKLMKRAEVEIRACFKKAIEEDPTAMRLVVSMAAKYLKPEAIGPAETEIIVVPNVQVSLVDQKIEQQMRTGDRSAPTTRRVKKGRAGKGKSRKKPVVSIHYLFKKVAREKIVIEGPGGPVEMELLEAYLRKMQLLACNNVGAARLVNELRRLFPAPPSSGEKLTFLISEADEKL